MGFYKIFLYILSGNGEKFKPDIFQMFGRTFIFTRYDRPYECGNKSCHLPTFSLEIYRVMLV